MSLNGLRSYLALFLLLCIFSFPPPMLMAATVAPLQVVQSGSEKGLEIIKSSLSSGDSNLREHRDEILKIVDQYFDFEEMAKRSLGPAWRDLPPGKKEEFVRYFKQLLFNIYVSRIEAAATPTTHIAYGGEAVEGPYATVKTRVAGENNPDVQIDYRLCLKGTEWKVYDVVIEGISLVGNYRQQFRSILNKETFDGLLKLLRQKAET